MLWRRGEASAWLHTKLSFWAEQGQKLLSYYFGYFIKFA